MDTAGFEYVWVFCYGRAVLLVVADQTPPGGPHFTCTALFCSGAWGNAGCSLVVFSLFRLLIVCQIGRVFSIRNEIQVKWGDWIAGMQWVCSGVSNLLQVHEANTGPDTSWQKSALQFIYQCPFFNFFFLFHKEYIYFAFPDRKVLRW